jgi:hypothetical protein
MMSAMLPNDTRKAEPWASSKIQPEFLTRYKSERALVNGKSILRSGSPLWPRAHGNKERG